MYDIVLEILEDSNGRNLNELVNKYKDHPNIAKIRNISYGIIRNYYAIEFITKKLVRHNNVELNNILKVGIFELWFSHKAEYAVINDLVEYTKDKYSNQGSANFVNAVLRSFQKDKLSLVEIINQDYLLKYNLPSWLLDKFKKQYKGKYLPIIQSMMMHPSFGLRVNNSKISIDNYLELLNEQKIDYKLVDGKLVLTNPMNVKDIPSFDKGFVSVQDIAAQYLINILTNNSIEFTRVLDACSAPGGKTCQLLENYACDLTSIDIDAARLERVSENLARLNLSAKILVGDSVKKNWWDGNKFDLIVTDVPCSATGTIKRNPDIKINRLESDIDKFVDIQKMIVANLWDMLADNGYMVYITCSILQEENQDNITWFKENLTGFCPLDEIQILPSEYNDGLYYCLIKKETKLSIVNA